MQEFEAMGAQGLSTGLSMCAGAVDGAQIPIRAPPQNEHAYCHRKGWHSMVLQGTVDAGGH